MTIYKVIGVTVLGLEFQSGRGFEIRVCSVQP
jgi:hypothetical protein